KLNSRLPREYCRPERAAELLDCKIEDLIHWAAIGAINFYVNAAMAMEGIKTIGTYLPEEVEPEFVIEPDPMEGEFKFGAAFSFVRAGGYILSDDGYCRFDAGKIYGFWRVSPSHVQHWELEGGIPESDEYSLSLFSSFDFCSSVYLHDKPDIDITLEVMASFPRLKDNLWLMREDLEKLHQHIHTGERIPIKAGEMKRRRDVMRLALGFDPMQQSLALETQQPSHGEVCWDNARAGILAAALHLVAKNPDIIKTIGQLADGSHDHVVAVCENKVGRRIARGGAHSLVDLAIKEGKVFFSKPKE
ncbi:hypothetical protein, partial [Aeromonas rivipollensis]|uniref:hypothetical protein n=1 Tax=Aeromonas rivipollensis TaxID=948519 RepID=UPI001F309559